MFYRCGNCGLYFTKEEMAEKEIYGVRDDFSDHHTSTCGACPYCNSPSFEEVEDLDIVYILNCYIIYSRYVK